MQRGIFRYFNLTVPLWASLVPLEASLVNWNTHITLLLATRTESLFLTRITTVFKFLMLMEEFYRRLAAKAQRKASLNSQGEKISLVD
jgi:hypothetical protein